MVVEKRQEKGFHQEGIIGAGTSKHSVGVAAKKVDGASSAL